MAKHDGLYGWRGGRGLTMRPAGQPLAILAALTVAAASVIANAASPAAAAAGSAGAVQDVTCPDLGSFSVSPAAATVASALPAGVSVSVTYQAVDTRTGKQVTGGQSPGPIQCAALPFAGVAAKDVAPGTVPAGVAPDDLLTGRWTVSIAVDAHAAAMSPTAQPPRAAPAVTASDLAGSVQSFLSTRAGSASAAVFDASSGQGFATPQGSYITASIVKVDILATLLRRTGEAGRGLTSSEQATASRMIEISDNSAATALWNEVGGAPAVAGFNALIGMPDTHPGPGGFWGLTTTTASDQVQLMRTIAYPNPVLNDGQRGYIEALMQNVTPSQRWGVSGGVPQGVSIAIKDGWIPGSPSSAVTSIGHIAGAGKDYVIAVLSSDPSFGYGIATIEGASSIVWAGLPVSGTRQLSTANFYFRNELTNGVADISLMLGSPGDVPIAGDWNGDGTDTPGVVRGGSWYLRNELTTGTGDISLNFGIAGDIPLVGDWTGLGKDGIGVFRNGTWYLRTPLTSGAGDVSFNFGLPGDIPVIGDWNGDGKDGIGVFRNGVWYLRNSLSTGPADAVVYLGNPGDTPVVGDWAGRGTDGLGVKRGAAWFLRTTPTSGTGDIAINFGLPTDIPLTGEWLGGKSTRIAVAR